MWQVDNFWPENRVRLSRLPSSSHQYTVIFVSYFMLRYYTRIFIVFYLFQTCMVSITTRTGKRSTPGRQFKSIQWSKDVRPLICPKLGVATIFDVYATTLIRETPVLLVPCTFIYMLFSGRRKLSRHPALRAALIDDAHTLHCTIQYSTMI